MYIGWPKADKAIGTKVPVAVWDAVPITASRNGHPTEMFFSMKTMPLPTAWPIPPIASQRKMSMKTPPIATPVSSPLILGHDTLTEKLVTMPSKTLAKHCFALGSTGSGKTVLGKVFIEEVTRQGVPSIIVDPQGDLSSLLLREDTGKVRENGLTGIFESYHDKVEVRIFTPVASRGIPISINPFKPVDRNLPMEELTKAMDVIAVSLAQLARINPESKEGRMAKYLIATVMERAHRDGLELVDFDRFGQMLLLPMEAGLSEDEMSDLESLVPHKNRIEISRRIRLLGKGIDRLMFNFGAPMNVGTFLTPTRKGKVPVNIIYLNTLTDERHKQFFVMSIAKEIHDWMLQHPSGELQLFFYMDEVAPYVPPFPRNPPAKQMITTLFRQGRKYGVGCMMATQNPADVDYKVVSQANTQAIGRMMQKQDVEKVKQLVRAIDPDNYEAILRKLPNLIAGEFFLFSPDVFDRAVRLKARWLVSAHRTLNESQVQQLVPFAQRQFFASIHPPHAEDFFPEDVSDLESVLPDTERVPPVKLTKSADTTRENIPVMIPLSSERSVEAEEAIDEIDQVDMIDQVDEIDQVDMIDQVDEIDQVDMIDQVDEIDQVDKSDQDDMVDQVDEIDQVDMIDQVDEVTESKGNEVHIQWEFEQGEGAAPEEQVRVEWPVENESAGQDDERIREFQVQSDEGKKRKKVLPAVRGRRIEKAPGEKETISESGTRELIEAISELERIEASFGEGSGERQEVAAAGTANAIFENGEEEKDDGAIEEVDEVGEVETIKEEDEEEAIEEVDEVEEVGTTKEEDEEETTEKVEKEGEVETAEEADEREEEERTAETSGVIFPRSHEEMGEEATDGVYEEGEEESTDGAYENREEETTDSVYEEGEKQAIAGAYEKKVEKGHFDEEDNGPALSFTGVLKIPDGDEPSTVEMPGDTEILPESEKEFQEKPPESEQSNEELTASMETGKDFNYPEKPPVAEGMTPPEMPVHTLTGMDDSEGGDEFRKPAISWKEKSPGEAGTVSPPLEEPIEGKLHERLRGEKDSRISTSISTQYMWRLADLFAGVCLLLFLVTLQFGGMDGGGFYLTGTIIVFILALFVGIPGLVALRRGKTGEVFPILPVQQTAMRLLIVIWLFIIHLSLRMHWLSTDIGWMEDLSFAVFSANAILWIIQAGVRHGHGHGIFHAAHEEHLAIEYIFTEILTAVTTLLLGVFLYLDLSDMNIPAGLRETSVAVFALGVLRLAGGLLAAAASGRNDRK